jgi:HSP20 family molecular chaperone IbpA
MSSTCASVTAETLGTVPRELRANVFAHGWGVVVQVFVPGCGTRDVRLRVDGEVLTVVAALPTREGGLPLVCERVTGEAEREFILTPDLDLGRLTRSLADGVLTMVIPRQGSVIPEG